MFYPTRNYRLATLLVTLLLSAFVSAQELDLEALESAGITNFRAPDASVLSSGQPSREQIQVLADAGVEHVINLRTAGEEVDFDEQAAVEALGMRYYSIPVAGGAGVNRDNAQALAATLAQLGDEPVLIHCASGNRVGGLQAVLAHTEGASVDAALAEGARWGMTSERLQQVVRATLADD